MAPSRDREPLSKVDAAWLHMDSPTNMMVINSVMVFDRPIDFQRLKVTYGNRMVARYPRFRMRVREGGLLNGPRWEKAPHFSLDSHVHRIALPSPGDQAMLEEVVGDLMSTPLDHNKPLWQVHLIDNYGGGCAIVTRLGHCIADGIALMQVLLDMADMDPDAPWPEPPQPDYEYKPPIWTRLIVPAMSAVDSTLRFGENMIHEGMETLVHPARVMGIAKAGAGVAKFGTGYALALGKLLLLPPDRKTVFKGKLGVTKRAAWTQPLPLSDVKTVGRLLCGTVNDVLLSCVAGGLRRYLQGRGEKTDGLNLRAMVPVNLRTAEEFGQLGNRFGLIYLDLPVGIEDTQERLHELKHRMDAIKNTPEALVAFDILNTIGMTPTQVEKILTSVFAIKATAVMTNVPGPRQPLYFAGAPIRTFIFWVPTSAELSLGVSIFSYDGQVTIGVATDAGLAPDPDQIISGIEAEFRDMQEYVRYVREDTDDEDFGLPMEAATEGTYTQPVSPGGSVGEPSVNAAEPLDHGNPLTDASADGYGTAVSPSTPMGAGSGLCQAQTKAGRPCRNRALAGQTTCRVHAAQV